MFTQISHCYFTIQFNLIRNQSIYINKLVTKSRLIQTFNSKPWNVTKTRRIKKQSNQNPCSSMGETSKNKQTWKSN